MLFHFHHLVTRIEVEYDLTHCEESADIILREVDTGPYLLWLSCYTCFYLQRDVASFLQSQKLLSSASF